MHSASRVIVVRLGKAAAASLAALASLATAALVAGYVVAFGGFASSPYPVFLLVFLAVLATCAFGLTKVSWRARVVLSILLLGAVVLMAPRSACAVEASSQVDC